MTSRTYLSIGDVLTLLREEFPDVTISKIRFLESQGLVNPERSPSGYRKFFEADVERLRWVLRQQREHFLPLKVIRDRLADGDLNEGAAEPDDGAVHVNGKSSERAHAVAGAGHADRGHAAGLGTATAPRTAEESTQADDEAMARILADASRRAARAPESVGEQALLEAVPDPGAPTSPGPSDVLNVPRARDLPHAADAVGLRADPDAPSGDRGPTIDGPRESGVVPHDGDDQSRAGAVPPASPADTPARREAEVAPPPVVGAEASAATVPTSRHRAPGVLPRAAAGVAEGGPSGAGDTGSAVGPPAAAGSGRTAGDGPTASAEARAVGARAETGRQSGATDRGGAAPDKRAAGAGGGGNAPRPAGGGGKAAAGAAASPPPAGTVTGASLTGEELCAASGLSEIELAGLQGFGLIEPVLVAGIATFDEDALTVANLAAGFRKFGIEARHLRLYRNAVDREMGLIEQVIIPLLRQRNPESRQRAVDAADELGALGQTMRATLLRAALRRHVGG
jgi:DNA-binding transcriptional MerR regulator